jgi:type I restriction enzyme R subunit
MNLATSSSSSGRRFMGGFSEADLVEQPAIDLFAALGWQTANLMGEVTGGASSQGRASKRDVILPGRLRLALKRLNPDLPQEALDDAYSELARGRGAIDPIRANAEFHDLLREGVKVDVCGHDGARIKETVRVINWQTPEQNDFFLASQVWFAGELYTKRADLIGFVNGLLLLFIELKASHKAMADAYNDNLSDYRATIPHVFVPDAFVILSNGLEAVVGASHAPLEYFNEWKRIDAEEEPGVVSLDTLIKGTCRPARFLDIVENFIAFEEGKHGLIKKLAKTHQLLGVNRAIAAVDKIEENRGRLGVFWHTQGSGKSLSMLFFARKVLRKKTGDWTFLIVTDRTELDDQIAGTFAACGELTKVRETVQAQSRDHLKELLRGNERYSRPISAPHCRTPPSSASPGPRLSLGRRSAPAKCSAITSRSTISRSPSPMAQPFHCITKAAFPNCTSRTSSWETRSRASSTTPI